MNIYLMSNINIDPLKAELRKTGITSKSGGYNSYMNDLLMEGSEAYKDENDFIYLHLDGEEFLSEMNYELPNIDKVETKVAELFGIVENFILKSGKSVIISDFVVNGNNFLTYSYNRVGESFVKVKQKLNELVYARAEKNNKIIILPFEKIVTEYGYKNLFDMKYWYLGRIKNNKQCFELISDEIRKLTNAVSGKTKKVLVLDLDNTLWGGIAGEDGVAGIKVSEDGIGKAYRDFQKAVKSLKNIGIILALNSKNNYNDIKEVFEKNNMMILKEEDFIVKKINWQTKAENMKEIANELNLGLDSLVFIDDNPVEREFIKEALPMVEVPEFPTDITNLKNWFIKEVVYNYFGKVSITSEDLDRNKQYEINNQREEMKKTLTHEEFLKELKMGIKIYKDNIKHLERVSQLVQKTNQFNLTTRRHTEGEVENFIKSDKSHVFSLEYQDKFNNEGIIGVAIAVEEKGNWHMDIMLLSCRVIGRNVEFVFFREILKQLLLKGAKTISGEYIATAKNEMTKEYYINCGMSKLEENSFYGETEEIIENLEKYNYTEVEIL